MTLDEILQHHAPCCVTLDDSSMIYCRRLNAGNHPDKGPTVRIEDADGQVQHVPAESVVEIRNEPRLPQ